MKSSTLPPNVVTQPSYNNTLIYDESMDVSFFNYFSTVTLGLMCYTFINPGFMYNSSIFMAYTFARIMIAGTDFFSSYIYKPYHKYIYKPLFYILNIDNGLYEVEVVKKGKVLHRFKTMDDFIKHNPIEFVYDSDGNEDDDSSDNRDMTSQSKEQEQPDLSQDPQPQQDPEPTIEVSVDADLTNESVNIHESRVNEDAVVDTETDVDSRSENGSGCNDDNFILKPSKYDFVLRNIYFEDDNLDVPYGFCLKYDTFRKTDMKTKYSYDDLKNMLSKRRFIGIHLKTDEKEYMINLASPINYYLVGNTILDYSFLKMYVFNRYNIILGKTYKLSCIDNFIEMYNIEQGKKVLIKDNIFKIVDDETYYNDSDSSSCSGSQSETDTESESESESDTGSQRNSHSPKEENKTPEDATADIDIEIVDCNFNPTS